MPADPAVRRLRCSGGTTSALVNDGLPRALPPALLRLLRLWPLRPARRLLLGRGLGRRGALLLDAARARPRAGARHVDGRHGHDRLHRQVPGARDRRLRRLRHGPLRRLPAHAVPLLAADGRVGAARRLLRRARRSRPWAPTSSRRTPTSSTSSGTWSRTTAYTIRQACLAMETMDIEHLARAIRRPILFTNGTRDIMTPPGSRPPASRCAQIVEACRTGRASTSSPTSATHRFSRCRTRRSAS